MWELQYYSSIHQGFDTNNSWMTHAEINQCSYFAENIPVGMIYISVRLQKLLCAAHKQKSTYWQWIPLWKLVRRRKIRNESITKQIHVLSVVLASTPHSERIIKKMDTHLTGTHYYQLHKLKALRTSAWHSKNMCWHQLQYKHEKDAKCFPT